MNCLSLQRRTAAVKALVEGMVDQCNEPDDPEFLKLLRTWAVAAASYHDEHVRNLRARPACRPMKIWAFVHGKDKNLAMKQVQADGLVMVPFAFSRR
jgi:hypothetical protein